MTRSHRTLALAFAASLFALSLVPAALHAQATRQPPDRETMALESLLEALHAIERVRAAQPADRGLAIHRLDVLYRVGVHEEWAVEEGLAALDSLGASATADSALWLAWRGAFRTLQGKHAFWPTSKIGHVRAGLSLLDRAVEMAPASARVRYLRLLSGYYLPGLFRRGDEVRDDFSALAALLPAARPEFSSRLYAEACRFVLEHGDLTRPEAAALRSAIAPSKAAGTGTDGR